MLTDVYKKGFEMKNVRLNGVAKNYINKGEANDILYGIKKWSSQTILDESFPSETTLKRIQTFVDTVLSAEDREAVRLDEIDKQYYMLFAQYLEGSEKRAEYQRALDMDVDFCKLVRVIRGEK